MRNREIAFTDNCNGKHCTERKPMQEEYGKKLSEAKPKYLEIYGIALGRLVLVFLIVLAGEGGFGGIKSAFSEGKWQMCVIGVLVGIALALFTLRHKKDFIEFYEYGICWRGRWYDFDKLGDIHFKSVRNGYALFFDAIFMQTGAGNFNLSYVEHPKRAYNRAYLNTMKEK